MCLPSIRLVFCLSFLSIGCFLTAAAQRIGLDFLFQPNLTIGASIVPTEKVEDSLSFGVNRFYTNLVVPLSGQLQLDLDDFDASFSQHFLTLNTGLRLPTGDLLVANSKLVNFSAGMTGVRAGLQRGVWFYTINGGFVQDVNKLDETSPFGTAALAWVRVKGIYKHTIYGVALLYQYKRMLPVPIIGINRRYNKKWFLELLLPAQGAMRYQFSKKFRAGGLVALGSFRAGAIPSARLNNLDWGTQQGGNLNLNYTEIKLTSVYEYKISKRVVFTGELGVSALRRLYFLRSAEEQANFEATTVPYAGINLQIDLKKSLISSRLFGNDF